MISLDQTCQPIDPQQILKRTDYRAFFHTNERVWQWLQESYDLTQPQRVFAIGGGGDFAFSSCALFPHLEEIHACDHRAFAHLTTDLKAALMANLSVEDYYQLFIDKKATNKNRIYDSIKENLDPISREVFDPVFSGRQSNFLAAMKKSKLWYRDSFPQILRYKTYLPYLIPENFAHVKPNLQKIYQHCGDFYDTLHEINHSFDLIYTSNIFDHLDYCPDPPKYLAEIRARLSPDGQALLITQHKPKKTVDLLAQNGFTPVDQKETYFNAQEALMGHYDYSFLLFRPA